MKIIKGADQKVAKWSGGTTTQLAIWPETASYADREFMWRLSTATVDEEESVFTSLPDYQRFLGIREGVLMLNHGDNHWLYMTPDKVTTFDGGAPTRSRGKVTDMNLMVRKEAADGAMQSVNVTGECKGRFLKELFDIREAVQSSLLDLCTTRPKGEQEDWEIFALYHSGGSDMTLQLSAEEGDEILQVQAGDLVLWKRKGPWRSVRVTDCGECHVFGFWVRKKMQSN